MVTQQPKMLKPISTRCCACSGMDGVRFPNNKQMRFTRLDLLTGQSQILHAEGRWVPEGDEDPIQKGVPMSASSLAAVWPCHGLSGRTGHPCSVTRRL